MTDTPMVRRASRALSAIAVASALCGCTVGPNFHSPVVDSPPHFGATATDVPSKPVEAPVDATWWKSFQEPELTSLVDRLAGQNLDLKIAAERVLQAKAERTVAAAQGLPHIGARAAYQRVRESRNGTVSLLEPAPGAPLEFDQDDDMLQASWELDLFGRVRRSVEAANANTKAAVEESRAMTLSALAELAQTYFQLRGVQAREDVVNRNFAAALKRAALVKDRYKNGVATLSDVAQADAQASTIGEELPTLAQSEARMINAMGLLLAEPPRTLRPELIAHVNEPAQPLTVPIGLPATLLRRRPDIREAEARLHAATAETGVAVAAFYPDVSLTGSFGTESLGADHLFDAASRMFMAGPSLSLPIFEGGQLRGQLHLRRAEQREAAISYRKTVLQAWHDVDNALTAYAELQHLEQNALAVEENDEVALKVAEDRYRQGVETFIDVTSAQSEVFRAQDSLVRSKTDLRISLVTLYKALGGGWETIVR
jgi:NodT family efflux transporter outer membrane factor (OMF) lipoprotein